MQAAQESVVTESISAEQAPTVAATPLATAPGEVIASSSSELRGPAIAFAGAEESTRDQSGLVLPTSELTPLTHREQMAINLRLAMARLDEGDPDASPSPTAAATAKVVPFPGTEENPASKIVEVQFVPSETPRTANDTSKARIIDDAPKSEQELATETQLPVNRPAPATIAPVELTESDATPASVSTDAPPHAGKSNDPAKPGERPVSSGTSGTSAAWKDRNMDSTSTFASFSGPEGAVGAAATESDEAGSIPEPPRLETNDRLSATHWPVSGHGEAQVHRAGGLSTESARPVEAAASVERITALVSRETTLFRQHGSDSMAVVLRPDANTELLVHLSRQNGQIEANVRCERGDFHQLNALWSQLQEALGQQKVRLAPLEEATGDTSQFRQTGGGLSQQGQNREESARQSPADQQSMEEWPAPASPLQDPAHVRSRTGDLGRRHSTSRPGWETWA